MSRLFSVLGDSISTLAGYNPEGFAVFYDEAHKAQAGIGSPADTWWGRVIDRFGGTLLKNGSWSGSMVAGAGCPAAWSPERIAALADAQQPTQYLTGLFAALQPSCDIGCAVAEAQMSELIQKHILKNIQRTFRTDGSSYARYRQCFLSGALCQVVLSWVTTGMRESVEEMAALCCRMIPPELWA